MFVYSSKMQEKATRELAWPRAFCADAFVVILFLPYGYARASLFGHVLRLDWIGLYRN
jgi:hypothetical protein